VGHNHAWRGRLRTWRRDWRRWFCGHWRWRRNRRRHRNWSSRLCYRRRRNRRANRTHRRWHRWRCNSRCWWLRRWSGKCRPRNRRRNHDSRRRNRHRSGRRRSFHGRDRGYHRRSSSSGRVGESRSGAYWSLLLTDGVQNVAGPGNIRKIDLGLNLIAIHATGPRVLRRCLRVAETAQVSAHLLRFMLFHGTGVRFLLSNAYFRKCVENRFAFDFQLPGQIVDSNLAHPPFSFLRTVPLSLHINLTVSVLGCTPPRFADA
jgi:hypothetical protein